MTLFLLGYMGSGKSVVGNKLAEVLGYNFVDLDGYIQEMEDATISEIFKTKGEIYFRKIENSYLKEVINCEDTIISLGGGTPCYGNNMDIILESNTVISIYLKASIQTLVKRLIKEKSKRPLLSHIESESDFMEFIGKHLFERAPYYEQSSHVIKTDGLKIETIVDDLILKLF